MNVGLNSYRTGHDLSLPQTLNFYITPNFKHEF
jgi:hypothetical protein